MKSTKLFFISTLVALAFILGSCGATTEKNDAAEAKVECNNELKKNTIAHMPKLILAKVRKQRNTLQS